MKKIIFTLAICLFMPLIIKAHPPKKITLTYTSQTKTLTIDISHQVQNAEKHHIGLISISVDGKEVTTINYSTQSDKKGETAEVIVPEVTSGCTVTVKATCNEFGSKKQTLSVV
jgi:hypothetical protein